MPFIRACAWAGVLLCGTSMATEPAADNRPPQTIAASFDTSDDLFKFAFDAMGSNNPTRLVHGFEAAQLCLAAKASWDVIAPFLQAEPALGPERAARTRAAQSLRQRCRGFLDNDSSANNSIRSTIRARVLQNPSIYLRSAYTTELTTEQFLEAMNRGDWVLPNVAAHEILPRMVASRGLTGSTQKAMDVGIAFTLALCDIGRDCSEQSAEYQLGCAQFNRCAGGFEPFFLKELPPERRSSVAALRAEIAAAWIRRDSAYFGFPARP